MPVNIPERDNAGMSHGVEHMLNRGMAPDFCIIMKPWNWVYHEEPDMGATYIPDLMPCARKILYAIIDTLARERSEVGL